MLSSTAGLVRNAYHESDNFGSFFDLNIGNPTSLKIFGIFENLRLSQASLVLYKNSS